MAGHSVGFSWTAPIWEVREFREVAQGGWAGRWDGGLDGIAFAVRDHPTAAGLSPDGRSAVVAVGNSAVVWQPARGWKDKVGLTYGALTCTTWI